MKYIVVYFISLAVFLVIDFVWLGIIAKNLYSSEIGHLMAEKVKFVPAFIFYMLFVVGIVILVINPALEAKSLAKALIFGSVLGFVSYATYDLTNFATLKDWPLKVVIIDIIWGTFLTGTVATVSYLISNAIYK